MTRENVRAAKQPTRGFLLARRIPIGFISLFLGACVCGPWGDVQERKGSKEKNDSAWEDYNPILGMQCRSLTYEKSSRKKPESAEKKEPPDDKEQQDKVEKTEPDDE